MANEKFSDFTVQTDLSSFTGLVGFQTNTANYYITTSNFYDDLEANLDLTDFTTITGGAAGEVLTVNGTGTGLTWSTVSVATPGIADVLTANDTTNAGQEILFTGDGVVQTGTVRYDARGILDNTSGGSFLIARATFGDLDITASSGNLTLTSAGGGNKINFNGDAKLVSDLYDGSNSAGTAGQVLSSLGAGNGTQWVAAGGPGGTNRWTVQGSFQGWKENQVALGTPMAQFFTGGSGGGGLDDLGFWRAPFDVTISNIYMTWAYEVNFSAPSGGAVSVGLYKIAAADWNNTKFPDTLADWGSPLMVGTIPGSSAGNDFWENTFTNGGTVNLSAGDYVTILMSNNPGSGGSAGDAAIALQMVITE